MKQYIENMRESVTRPDRFYLGNLPGEQERLWAHLDELSTIVVPENNEKKNPPDARREEWVTAHRVASLQDDFVRALPVRLFGSVARIGFRDYEWWADKDLQWLVGMGEQTVQGLGREIQQLRLDALAPGGSERATEIRKKETARTKLTEELAAFRREMERRATPGDSESSAGSDPSPPVPG